MINAVIQRTLFLSILLETIATVIISHSITIRICLLVWIELWHFNLLVRFLFFKFRPENLDIVFAHQLSILFQHLVWLRFNYEFAISEHAFIIHLEASIFEQLDFEGDWFLFSTIMLYWIKIKMRQN